MTTEEKLCDQDDCPNYFYEKPVKIVEQIVSPEKLRISNSGNIMIGSTVVNHGNVIIGSSGTIGIGSNGYTGSPYYNDSISGHKNAGPFVEDGNDIYKYECKSIDKEIPLDCFLCIHLKKCDMKTNLILKNTIKALSGE